MRQMIKDSLAFMNSCRIMTASIILVLAVILVLQTYISENVFEMGRLALAAPISLRITSKDSEVYIKDYYKLGSMVTSDFKGFDVMANNYLDYKYNAWYGSDDTVVITALYNDCGIDSGRYFISDEIYKVVSKANTVAMSDVLFYAMADKEAFNSTDGKATWHWVENDFDVGFAYGANIDPVLVRDSAHMIASSDTYRSIIGDKPIDDLYVCSTSDIKLICLLKLIYKLKVYEGYEMHIVFASAITSYLKQMVLDNLIIFLGILNMMQIIFFVLNGRKQEFDILLLCGSTYKEIRIHRFINLCMYFIPASIIGTLIFNLLSTFILTTEYKFYTISEWQVVVNIILFFTLGVITFFIYEILEGRARKQNEKNKNI